MVRKKTGFLHRKKKETPSPSQWSREKTLAKKISSVSVRRSMVEIMGEKNACRSNAS
jgi:hypothetical protein